MNEHLPPDLRKQGGVGVAARENRASAVARAAATGAPIEAEDVKEQAESVAEKEADVKIPVCPRCQKKCPEDYNFCANCGRDLGTDPIKLLGIEFTDDDLDEYIFRGFLVKTVKVIGKDLVVRSSLAQDHRDLSDYLMTHWSDKELTSDFWENLKGSAAISCGVVSFDGKSIGDDLHDRVDWMMKRGAAFHDMISKKVVLFNRAVTEWLNKKNTFLAS